MTSTAVEEETRIGPYVLKRALGKGGSGHAYLAWKDNPTDQELPCVIKLPHHDQATDDPGRMNFLREARIALRIGPHANIVHVFDVGLHEGSMPYLAMEYVDGVDLGALLKIKRRQGKPLSDASIYNILVSVAAGLHHAHSARTIDGEPVRIVHRDVTPPNILVNQGGVVKLLDFGIGVAMAEGTTGNHLRGTYRYMSPEHLDGTPCPEMDIYSLGVVAWEMVENRVFRAECDGIKHMPAIMDGLIPEMRHADAQLVRIILSCLARHARNRPTAAELGEALTRWAKSRGYDRDPSVLEQELAPIMGATRPSGASKRNLAAPPELIATLAAVKQAAGVSDTTTTTRMRRDVGWEVLNGQRRERDAPRFYRRRKGSPLDPERGCSADLRVVSDVVHDAADSDVSSTQTTKKLKMEPSRPQMEARADADEGMADGRVPPETRPAPKMARWHRFVDAVRHPMSTPEIVVGTAAALLAAMMTLLLVHWLENPTDAPRGRDVTTDQAQSATSTERGTP